MAILTAVELASHRAKLYEDIAEGNRNFIKPQCNAAFQAIEDWFTSSAQQSAISLAINAATTPFVFTAAQKRFLVKAWLFMRFLRGN